MRKYDARNFLDSLSWREFEKFMGEFWARGGWDVEVTQKSRDGGIDVYLSHHTVPYTVGVDTKRYDVDTYSPSHIETWYQKLSDEALERADIVCLVTTTQFKRSAKGTARQYGIDLIGLRSVCDALSQVDPVLCQQWRDGHGNPTTDREIKARFLARGVSPSDKARDYLRNASRRDELLYALETSSDTPHILTEPYVRQCELGLPEFTPGARYPLDGPDSYLVGSQDLKQIQYP